MAWQDDPLFIGDKTDPFRVESFASPAFRLSMLSSFDRAHPFQHLEAYKDLFACFRPCLEGRAERLLMIEKPGGSARRRKTISAKDWDPLGHMASVIPADDGHFIGFQFQSGFIDQGTGDASENTYDTGPALFRLWVGSIVELDAAISLEDWHAGRMDIEKVMDAILRIPAGTALAGFGLALSDSINNSAAGQSAQNLLPVASKFPAIDISHNGCRRWFADYERDVSTFWIAGINWITVVGEPFLSALGGADALAAGLSPQIAVRKGRGNVMFQLGDRPITGEAGTDDALLPLYQALGGRLRPRGNGHPSTRSPRHPVFGESQKSKSLAWERRFYDGGQGRGEE